MRNGSGKEILNKIISVLSTIKFEEDELDSATRKIRAGLLLHGSTSEENFDLVSRLVWGSSKENGEVCRQGLATKNGNYFISDIFESIWSNEEIKKSILAEFDGLSEADYEAAAFAMWMIISGSQMFSQLQMLENRGEVNIEEWVDVVMRKFDIHNSSKT